MILERANGPECPRCGCADSEVLQAPPAGGTFFVAPDPAKAAAWPNSSWFAGGRARCRHCGCRFTFRELPELPEEPVVSGQSSVVSEDTRPAAAAPAAPTTDHQPPTTPHVCPECGGNWKPYKTRGKTQYRKCQACGHTGKTIKPDVPTPAIRAQAGVVQ